VILNLKHRWVQGKDDLYTHESTFWFLEVNTGGGYFRVGYVRQGAYGGDAAAKWSTYLELDQGRTHFEMVDTKRKAQATFLAHVRTNLELQAKLAATWEGPKSWHKVTKTRPPVGTHVLCRMTGAPGGVLVLYRSPPYKDGERSLFVDPTNTFYVAPKFWMPLPTVGGEP